MEKYNNITFTSAASHVPAAGTSNGAGIKKKEDDKDPIDVGYFQVDEDYAANMQLKLLAGKFFKAENGVSNKNFVVINESASKKLNYKIAQDAIGEPLFYSNDSTTRTIIGVVRDYNHRDLMRGITPMVLVYDPQSFNVLQVSYVGSYKSACTSIEKAWAAVNPGFKVDYTLVESEINKYYELIFGDLVNVLGFISFLAILISCLGLLGMATYSTETRIKEISIRKVLGSTNASLVLLLSKGFMTIIGLSIAIGMPLAYLANDFWLSQIAYHTQVGLGMSLISVLILLFFGAITIGSQTLRAAFVNPVDNLKSE